VGTIGVIMYIWQAPNWTTFTYQNTVIKPKLENVIAKQKKLIGCAKDLPKDLDHQAEMDAFIQNALQTSEIEGEKLNAGSVRSSVAKHLGLEQAGLPPHTLQTESLIAMLSSATTQLQIPISQQQLCLWQAALFPELSLLRKVAIGELRGEASMQVVSQKGNRETIHFQAPPQALLQKQLAEFIDWFNTDTSEKGIIRAAITHLWLITLHPFDDGNGRVTRALTDRALAQAEQTSIRFYSLSAAIEANRTAYYDNLENTQNCKTAEQINTPTDITVWISWFLDVLAQAMEQGSLRINRVVDKTRFWQTHSQTILNERQIKVLNRLLDNAGEEFLLGVNASKYQSLTKVSKATATRDLANLVAKGCLKQAQGGGRSTRYTIN